VSAAGDARIEVVVGDITRLAVDAIVPSSLVSSEGAGLKATGLPQNSLMKTREGNALPMGPRISALGNAGDWTAT